MLSVNAKRRALDIARQLNKEGMLWGDELEIYIKSQVYTKKGFKSDEEYLEFENVVLDYLEERRQKKKFKISCFI